MDGLFDRVEIFLRVLLTLTSGEKESITVLITPSVQNRRSQNATTSQNYYTGVMIVMLFFFQKSPLDKRSQQLVLGRSIIR